jgi:hypothetical protein
VPRLPSQPGALHAPTTPILSPLTGSPSPPSSRSTQERPALLRPALLRFAFNLAWLGLARHAGELNLSVNGEANDFVAVDEWRGAELDDQSGDVTDGRGFGGKDREMMISSSLPDRKGANTSPHDHGHSAQALEIAYTAALGLHWTVIYCCCQFISSSAVWIGATR